MLCGPPVASGRARGRGAIAVSGAIGASGDESGAYVFFILVQNMIVVLLMIKVP